MHFFISARWRQATLVLLAACLTLTSGCQGHLGNWCRNGFKVGPAYRKPAAPVAVDWIDAYDERVRQELPDDPAWWTVFNDPILNGLIEDTYRQNLPLREAGIRVVEARLQRQIAAGNLFPQAQQGFLEYSRGEVSQNTFPTNNLVPLGLLPPNAVSNWASGLDASWELDVWGRFRRSIESADASLNASIEDYDAILVSLIGETATTYIEYRVAQQRLAYVEANVKIQAGSLEISDVQFKNGAVTELDVTQATSNLLNTKQLIPVYRTQLRQANNLLCVLTGIPPQDLAFRLGDQPIPSTPADVVVGIPANLIRRRPDVRQAEREVAAQSALIGVAAADLFPSFSVVGAFQVSAEHFADLFDSDSTTSFISPGFNWNLLNYGRLANNVRVQDARFQQLALAYQETVLEANAEVENGIVAFLQSQQSYLDLEGAVKAANRSVDLAQAQYRDGAINFNRVFTLETALTSQQDQLAIAQGDIARNLVAVYKALGGGWQIRFGAGPGVGQPIEVLQPGDIIPQPAPEVPAAGAEEAPGAAAEQIDAPAAENVRQQRTEVVERGQLISLPLMVSNDRS